MEKKKKCRAIDMTDNVKEGILRRYGQYEEMRETVGEMKKRTCNSQIRRRGVVELQRRLG